MTDWTHTHLTEAQRGLFTRVRTLAAEVLAPLAASGTPGTVNRPLLAALADPDLVDGGLLGRVFRRDEGGRFTPRVTALDLCLIREGLALHCTEAETAFALQGLGGHPILASGRPEVVEDWVPRIADGTAVAAFALTEPEAGSDAAALELSAVRDGDGFRLTGEKTYISNAPDADVYSVFARTTPGGGTRGITAFLVPGDSAGLSGERLRLLAPHPIGRLRFDDVRVPAEHVLGEVGGGWAVAMTTLTLFRPSVGAFAVGMAQAALDAACAHARSRTAFGRPLRDFQAVSHQLAEMATRVHAARLLVHQAATARDEGVGDVRHLAAMAKLFATETAQTAVDVAVQVHGAHALEEGHPLEHLYREVRAPRIYEGTSEIQREIIARHLLGR
ncbi:Acyl-CoA dehydrogenase [Streptoalloteichus tenebrarius]|uniref:Acyl-CoA dehydrogenase n=1 Tax=Streptoalloteichus tenebrarius (strain ATCC 17920 / DSM 40477 / JCM 4838 / CBS 697.72 / NBRC 16177 / NCIMB 11028 / NRRL B-12390 / A12253. 1 / ISP 5477) TaxID=1933 RepID=A0ABT1HYT6_STRSD|nr:acyl-CoA dehydrogenase family protein [Streptoalloteichus tenebrarius]MCP2260697.1 Acyl-CoA dehydrogenase [Streptoalloteichus tenebrarius]BFF03770.1 acyl-CoA dehydrogenase family protein [Streptoalloteichus tenebrarius]